MKNDINFIYYIIILYYTEQNKLLSFIRFYTSKLNNYGLISSSQIYNYRKLLGFNKGKLIQYLNKLINTNEEILLFFIICIQLYFKKYLLLLRYEKKLVRYRVKQLKKLNLIIKKQVKKPRLRLQLRKVVIILEKIYWKIKILILKSQIQNK